MLVGGGNLKCQSFIAFGLVLFMPSPEPGILSEKENERKRKLNENGS